MYLERGVTHFGNLNRNPMDFALFFMITKENCIRKRENEGLREKERGEAVVCRQGRRLSEKPLSQED